MLLRSLNFGLPVLAFVSYPSLLGPLQFSKLDTTSVTKILYQNMMSTEPDTSARNVRVAPSKAEDVSGEKARYTQIAFT